MQDFSSVLLANVLQSLIQHVEETPELDQNERGVSEFKDALRCRVEFIRRPEDHHDFAFEPTRP
jgi:hypothetical protein